MLICCPPPATGVTENIPQGFRSSNVVVMGNQIKQTGWHGIQSDVAGETTTDSITVMNNSITSVNWSGIYGVKVSNWNITGNVVHYAGEHGNGITIEEGGSGTSITWNTVTNSVCSGIDVLINLDSGVNNLTITHNIVFDSGQYNLIFRNADKSPTYYGGSGFLIAYNNFNSFSDSYSNYYIHNNGSVLQLYSTDIHDNQGSYSMGGLL